MQKILFIVIFCFGSLLVSCGGGGGESSNDQPAAGGNTGNNSGTNTGSCNLSPPVCTISVTPSTSDSNRAASGTNFYLVANCNTNISSSNWYEGKDLLATNMLSISTIPIVEKNYTLDIPYTFNYANCAGKGSDKKFVYITGGSSSGSTTTGGGGGSTSGGGTTNNSGGGVSVSFVGWYKHSDGGDIARFKLVNTKAIKQTCVNTYSLEYYDQFYLDWKSDGNQLVKDVNANSSATFDIHYQPQNVRGVLIATMLRNVQVSPRCS